jgi:hypothetical protein
MRMVLVPWLAGENGSQNPSTRIRRRIKKRLSVPVLTLRSNPPFHTGSCPLRHQQAGLTQGYTRRHYFSTSRLIPRRYENVTTTLK